jgi:hypothetical protein
VSIQVLDSVPDAIKARKDFLEANRDADADLRTILGHFHERVVGVMLTSGVLHGITRTDDQLRLALTPATIELYQGMRELMRRSLEKAAGPASDREEAAFQALLGKVASVSDAAPKPKPKAKRVQPAPILLPGTITIKAGKGRLITRLADLILDLRLGGEPSLSNKLWRYAHAGMDQAIEIIRAGLADGKDALRISKDLEEFLIPRPGAKDTIWSHTNAPSRLKKRISAMRGGIRTGRNTVSYNYLRIARTEMNRVFRASHLLNLKFLENALPFKVVKAVHWNLSNTHPAPDICDEWASADDYDLGEGNYPIEDVPEEHPNGGCNTTSVLISPEQFLREMKRADFTGVPIGTPEKLMEDVVDKWGEAALGYASWKK